MATTTMVTAAGVAMLLYFVLSRRISIKESEADGGGGGHLLKERRMGSRRIVRRPAQAPATWREAAATLAETLRFTYSETLGKWPIGDLAFGIKYLMRRQIIGHSLGGGTAALLTYILREREEFSSSTCIAFAPAACMTWDLAESGKHFITTIINGSDLVPSFSTAAFDNLRSEVTASSWLNDLRDQIQNTRFMNVVYRSASALGSHLPSISTAKARVADAGALLRPVSTSTQVVMKRAQNVAQAVVRSRSTLSSWSCMGARRRAVGTVLSTEQDNSNSLLIEVVNGETTAVEVDYGCSHSDQEEAEEEELILADHVNNISTAEDMTEGDLWFELEKELHRRDEHIKSMKEEEAAAAKEITEEETEVLKEAVENKQPTTLDSMETQQFYPPGRIMHMVVLSREDANSSEDVMDEESCTGIYETPRDLYNKIRLSPTMINDHYMPMYKKTMELLIDKLGEDEGAHKHEGTVRASVQVY